MRPAIRVVILLAGTSIALSLAGPAWSGGGGGGGVVCHAFTDGPVDRIALQDHCIEPVAASVAAGTTLEVSNVGQDPHTLTAVDGSFDTGVLEPGETAEIELPVTPQSIPVYCTLHAGSDGTGMAGLLTVGAPMPAAVSAGTAGASLTAAAVALVAGLIIGVGIMTTPRRRMRASTGT